MLLPAETNVILEERYGKSYAIRFFGSGNSKVVFTLLTEIMASYIVVTLIKIEEKYLEGLFLKAFCNSGSGLHYCLDDVLYYVV